MFRRLLRVAYVFRRSRRGKTRAIVWFRGAAKRWKITAWRARGDKQLAASVAASIFSQGFAGGGNARKRGYAAAETRSRRIRRDRCGEGGTRPAGVKR